MLTVMPRKSRLKLPPLHLGAESFGRRLTRIRKERGFTQVEIARKIGIIQALVSAYECDKIRLHAEMVVRFAQALEVSADELLGLAAKKSNGTFKNRRLVRRLQQLERLPRRDQEAVIRTLDAFLKKGA
jgi:transcriptional regulator with XRE-family HTH domain